jgi:hypothetical protein
MSNDDHEIAVRVATQNVSDHLRNLAANVLWVICGAGKPDQIEAAAEALLDAMTAYRETVGDVLSPETVANALRIDVPATVPKTASEGPRASSHSQQLILRGALQIAAARLSGQHLQAAAGASQLQLGLICLDETQTPRD